MAMGRRRKRGREPEVLRRAYRGRARTLQHTILSLPPRPPPTPAACLCRGRHCLACGGVAHLLRPDDPADYRALLTHSFCVVSPDAPPPPPADYLPQGSTQRSLVRNVLELMKANSQVHTNVLCNDYDQQRHFGTISESLCTSSWDLLLTRIGDALMVFLLKYSSIFTPFTRKNYHQVTGTPLDKLIKSSKILCPTSISRNQQSWLGDHILHGNQGCKMKRRYKSEDTKLDAPFSILQPSSLLSADESTDFNSRSVVIGNCRKSVRECRSIDREPGFLRSHPCDSKTGNFVDKDNSNANYQDRLTTNPCHHPENFSRPYSRDVTDAVMLEGKKFYCTLRDYKLESGEELMNASLLSSDLHEMNAEQVVSSNSVNTCDVILTSGADNFRKSATFKREARKHARLFSWQRRKKRKLNPGIVLNNKTSTEDKDSPNVEIQHNSGIKHCHHHFDSTRSNKFGNITELYPSAYQNPVTIPKSITLEEYEAISRINVHSVHAEEMNQKHLDTSVENDQDCAKHLADNETEVGPHTDIGCSDTPCMHMKNTLQAVISDKRTTPATLQRKSTRAEFTSLNSCSSMKQKELHSHSDKMASWCFNCLMMQAPQKVVARDHIKRRFIFYDRFLSASVFPRNHILNKLNPNDSGARYLMKHIFGIAGGQVNTCSPLCSRCSGYSSINSECLYHSLLRLLKSLIRNAQRCWNRKLLRKHCLVSPFKQFCKDFTEPTSKLAIKGRPSPKLSKKKDTSYQHSSNTMLADGSHILRTGNEKREHPDDRKSKVCLPLLEPSKAYCRHQQVTSFIWSITRRIVPLDLLGDPTTWRTLRKNISKFVRLRRFEAFCLKQCCHGLKPSCLPFLSKIRFSDCNCKKCTNVTLSGKSTMKEPGSFNIRALHNKVFQFWIYWFFSYIVVPMIGANFYVTENQSGRQDVFYYPKPVWRKLVGRAITNMSKQNYRHIDSASLRLIFKKRAFGFSKVRFLPNDNGLRPIANLRAPSKLRLPHNEYAASNKKAKLHGKLTNTNRKRKLVYRKPVNSCLHELHAVLRKIKIDYPQKLGSSVFDYNGIYQKLLQFLSKAKSGTNKRSQVFIVVADVSKAFDSIDQDMLIDIMQDILENDEYLLRRYAQVVCTKKSTNTVYSQVPYDKHTNKVNTTFGISGHFYSTSGILIDQGTNNKIKQEELHYLLWEHLKHNVVQFGRNFYLQKVGIPQGSLLSSLLCSYYYGHLERSIILPFLEKAVDQPNPDIRNNKEVANRCVCTSNVSTTGSVDNAFSEMDTLENRAYLGHSRITNLNEEQLRLSTSTHSCLTDHAAAGCTDDDKCETSSLPDHILLRFIDDFLFISTSQKQAASFFNRMRRGFSYYNCFMNNQKFGINFDMEQNRILVNRKYTGSDGISYLPWSGLLLNCQTLEVQADYTRYWGVHISSTITVPAQAKPARHLRRKLCDYMRPKCHPIFYDSKINSPTTVSLNAYQAFLLCAMKFHCYVSSMPDITMQNPSYFLEIIEMSFGYMYKLIKKRMNDMRQSLNVNPTFNLKKAEIVWLGLSAYIRVLKKKQSRYKQLLSLLRCKFLIHGRTCNSSSHLKYTNDDSHSSMFWKIKF